jgi:hypothetical protein
MIGRLRLAVVLLLAALALAFGVIVGSGANSTSPPAKLPRSLTVPARPGGVPGYPVPPLLDPQNVYAADGAGDLSPVVRGLRPLVYVPGIMR